jgi:ankyrin repeat protein
MYHDAFQVYELLDKWNAQGPPQADQVQALFSRDPSSAHQEFLFGQTLLHKCVEYYSNRIDLVQIFLDSYPQALTKKDANGFLPIHRALISGAGEPTLELIQLFVTLAPQLLLETTPNGALPLHLACARYDTAIVRYLVDCFPESIQHRDNQGRFPLQHALEAQRPQPDMVQLLLEHYPIVLSFLDEEGYLPLHRILEKGRTRYDSIVELLVHYCPGALRFQELQDSQTPLVLACQNNNSVSQIYSLVRSWPEQVSTRGGAASMIFETHRFNGEMLPSALGSPSATVERLEAWIALYPENVSMPDLQGRLPLHYAAMSKSGDALEMVQYLLSSSYSSSSIPSSTSPSNDEGEDDDNTTLPCQVADRHGRLALHYAAAAGNGEIVELLSSKYPAGLIHADEDGRLPWHYAECARLDMVYEQTLEYAGNCDPNSLSVEDEDRIGDLDLVPDEIRFDLIQVGHDEQCW